VPRLAHSRTLQTCYSAGSPDRSSQQLPGQQLDSSDLRCGYLNAGYLNACVESELCGSAWHVCGAPVALGAMG
jgi:hypothetical protein